MYNNMYIYIHTYIHAHTHTYISKQTQILIFKAVGSSNVRSPPLFGPWKKRMEIMRMLGTKIPERVTTIVSPRVHLKLSQ